MSPPPAATVGARLREAREQRGLPLRQIAERTRISVMALEALERNDVKRLPGGLFTRAFVRAYASEVGLNPDRAVEDFVAQFPHDPVLAGGPGRPIEDNEAIEADRRIAETLIRLVLLSLPVAAAVIYFGTRQPATAVPTGDVHASAAGRAPTEIEPTISTAETASDAVQFARAPVGGSVPEPAAAAGAGSGELMLVIAPQADCWVSVTVDGRTAPSQLLVRGQRREARALREIVVTIGDAGACAYTLNGHTGRPLGARGQVVTRRITLENYRALLIP